MQQQEQIQRIYTFEEICPDLSELLAQNGGFMENQGTYYETPDGKIRSLGVPNACVVGEAHNCQ